MPSIFNVQRIIRKFEEQFIEARWKVYPCSKQKYGAGLIENQDSGSFYVITGSDSEYPISLKRITLTRSRFSRYKGKDINTLIFMGKNFSKSLVSELTVGKINNIVLLEVGLEKKKVTIHSGSELARDFLVREVQGFTDKFMANLSGSSESLVNMRNLEKKSKLDRALETLRQRAKGVQEYEVIHESEERLKPPTGMVPETWIYAPEYEQAFKLKEELIRRFNGKSLQKAIPGKVVSNDYGDCYCIVDECNARFKKIDPEKSMQAILSDLKLIYGIGPVREQILKQQGYLTIEDLKKHSKWQPDANKFLRILEAKDISSLQSWMWRHIPKSHPLVHYLSGFCKEEDFAIFDIETLGLFGRPIILLGVAKPRRNKICTSQFLLRDIPDEPGALWEFISHLDEKTAFITFNGRAFDVPFIQERLAFYGMEASLNNPHFDVLHFARRAWRDKLADCRLDTIEKYFGIHRDADVPSALIPEFYDTYRRTQNVGPLVAIVEHNKQDILTLANLFSKLYEEWNL